MWKHKMLMKLIGPKKTERILTRYNAWIHAVSERYGVPASAIKAILYQEMTIINLMDVAADLVVQTNLFRKKDSSTGYAQIFGYVGVNALNFAVDRKLATYDSVGIACTHRLDPHNPKDVRLMWKKLRSNPKINIEIATMNLLAAADEVVGRTDFHTFSADELKLVLTRYNANTRHITPYGERAFAKYEEYEEASKQRKMEKSDV